MTRLYVEHPGYRHSGSIGDGSLVRCCGCGAMLDCYVHEGERWRGADETFAHELVCTWEPAPLG